MYCKDIFKLSSFLKPCSFINNIQYWTTINIYYVNKYQVVDISIFFQNKFELAR